MKRHKLTERRHNCSLGKTQTRSSAFLVSATGLLTVRRTPAARPRRSYVGVGDQTQTRRAGGGRTTAGSYQRRRFIDLPRQRSRLCCAPQTHHESTRGRSRPTGTRTGFPVMGGGVAACVDGGVSNLLSSAAGRSRSR